jgi:hypothetical protein
MHVYINWVKTRLFAYFFINLVQVLQVNIRKKVDALTKTEYLRRQARILVDRQRRESYVDPIEKCYEIDQHQERNQSPLILRIACFSRGLSTGFAMSLILTPW